MRYVAVYPALLSRGPIRIAAMPASVAMHPDKNPTTTALGTSTERNGDGSTPTPRVNASPASGRATRALSQQGLETCESMSSADFVAE